MNSSQRGKRWYAANKDKHNKRCLEYYHANKDRINIRRNQVRRTEEFRLIRRMNRKAGEFKMLIVLEGIDNSGKSTLAKFLSQELVLPIQGSEGPPKYDGEMNDRLKRYSKLKGVIFDRHPVVSQSIYGILRTGKDPKGMEQRWIDEFYERKPIFVYCDPGDERGMHGHTFNEGADSEEHLRQVEEGYALMLKMYREWAIKHAHLIYRIGDDMRFISQAIDNKLIGG